MHHKAKCQGYCNCAKLVAKQFSCDTILTMVTEHKNPARLISEIETEYGLKYGTLKGKKRTKHISNARTKAIVALREDLGLSFPDIGENLRRDHTTVMQMYNRSKKPKK